jgi:hypothetical protein
VKQIGERVGGRGVAFLLGVAFSLGFCPTMVLLFFGMVMPMTVQSSYGVILPPIFALGTAFPLLLFFALMIVFGVDWTILKKAKQWGLYVYKVSGLFFNMIIQLAQDS